MTWDGTMLGCSARDWTKTGWVLGSPAESQGLQVSHCRWKRTWKAEVIWIIYREPSISIGAVCMTSVEHELKFIRNKNVIVLNMYRFFFLATIP